jgi:hypothetical protein
MFIKEHPNDNSEKSANLRHGSSFLHSLPTARTILFGRANQRAVGQIGEALRATRRSGARSATERQN